MKRGIAASLALFVCSTFALAAHPTTSSVPRQPDSLLQEVVHLSQEGFSEETILVYLKAHRAELPSVLTAEDLVWLRKSGVSESVIRYLVSMAALDVGATGQGPEASVAYDSDDTGVYPIDPYYVADYPTYFYGSYYPYYGFGYSSYPSYYFDHHYYDLHGFPGHHGIGHHGFPGHHGIGHDGSFGHGRHDSHPSAHQGFSGHSAFGHSTRTHQPATAGHAGRAHPGPAAGGHHGGFATHRSGGHSVRGHSGGGHSGGGHSGGHSGGGHSSGHSGGHH